MFEQNNEYCTYLLMDAYFNYRQFSFLPLLNGLNNDVGLNVEGVNKELFEEYVNNYKYQRGFNCLICGNILHSHGYGYNDYDKKHLNVKEHSISLIETTKPTGFLSISPKLECKDIQCKKIRKYFAFSCYGHHVIDTDNFGFSLKISDRPKLLKERLRSLRQHTKIQNIQIDEGLSSSQYTVISKLFNKA